MCGQIKCQHIHCITLYTYNAGIAVVGIDKDASKNVYAAHKYTFTLIIWLSAIHLIYGNVRTIIITTISQCLGYDIGGKVQCESDSITNAKSCC